MKHGTKWILLVCVLAMLTLAGCKKDKGFAPNLFGGEKGEDASTETQIPTNPAIVDWEEGADTGSGQTTTGGTTVDGNATTATTPQQPETTATQPAETTPTTEMTQPAEDGAMTWEQYQALSNADKQAYFKTFATTEEFYQWLDAAKKAYEEQNKGNTITGDGSLNIGDFTGNR